jgi:hypothetical protein
VRVGTAVEEEDRVETEPVLVLVLVGQEAMVEAMARTDREVVLLPTLALRQAAAMCMLPRHYLLCPLSPRMLVMLLCCCNWPRRVQQGGRACLHPRVTNQTAAATMGSTPTRTVPLARLAPPPLPLPAMPAAVHLHPWQLWWHSCCGCWGGALPQRMSPHLPRW